jgi:hypothetical protein
MAPFFMNARSDTRLHGLFSRGIFTPMLRAERWDRWPGCVVGWEVAAQGDRVGACVSVGEDAHPSGLGRVGL